MRKSTLSVLRGRAFRKAVCAILCALLLASVCALAETPASLKQKLQYHVFDTIRSESYADFDGDGELEAFFVTEDPNDEDNRTVYLVSSAGVILVDGGYVTLGDQIKTKGVVLQEVFGRRWSDLYGVRNGLAVRITVPSYIDASALYLDPATGYIIASSDERDDDGDWVSTEYVLEYDPGSMALVERTDVTPPAEEEPDTSSDISFYAVARYMQSAVNEAYGGTLLTSAEVYEEDDSNEVYFYFDLVEDLGGSCGITFYYTDRSDLDINLDIADINVYLEGSQSTSTAAFIFGSIINGITGYPRDYYASQLNYACQNTRSARLEEIIISSVLSAIVYEDSSYLILYLWNNDVVAVPDDIFYPVTPDSEDDDDWYDAYYADSSGSSTVNDPLSASEALLGRWVCTQSGSLFGVDFVPPGEGDGAYYIEVVDTSLIIIEYAQYIDYTNVRIFDKGNNGQEVLFGKIVEQNSPTVGMFPFQYDFRIVDRRELSIVDSMYRWPTFQKVN